MLETSTRIIALASLAASLSFGASVYSTGFEASEGYTTGQLAGQQNWYNNNVPFVQNGIAASGAQAAAFTASIAGQHLALVDVTYSSIGNAGTTAIVAVDFLYQPSSTAVTWNPLAVFGDQGFLGQIRVANGNASLGLGFGSVGSVALTAGAWHNFQFVFDFATNTKTAFVDSTLIASLPFGAPGTGLAAVAIGQNGGQASGGGAAYWDNLSVVSTPEPGAAGLAVAGLGGLLALGYRRRSR